MQVRMESPALTVSGAMQALQKLGTVGTRTGLPEATLKLVELRVSQGNGCSVCVDMHARELEAAGEAARRAGVYSRRLTGGALFQRRRACGARVDRGDNPLG